MKSPSVRPVSSSDDTSVFRFSDLPLYTRRPRMLDDITVQVSRTLTGSSEKTPEDVVDRGARPRVYILVFERGSSWVFELPDTGEIVIGRGETAELRLRDNAVSRRHATMR